MIKGATIAFAYLARQWQRRQQAAAAALAQAS